MAAKKLKLTKELRAKLMGYSVATGALEFIPENLDVPDEYKPVFNVRNLTNKEYNEVKKFQNLDDEDKMEEKTLQLVRSCIVGWSNFIDIANDTYIEFKTDDDGVVDETLYDLMPLSLKTAIFIFILKINGIGV